MKLMKNTFYLACDLLLDALGRKIKNRLFILLSSLLFMSFFFGVPAKSIPLNGESRLKKARMHSKKRSVQARKQLGQNYVMDQPEEGC